MNVLAVTPVFIVLCFPTFAQSGRRARPASLPAATPESSPVKPASESRVPDPPPVTAEKDQDYRCTEDGTLAHLLDSGTESGTEKGYLPKEVDIRAEITARPEPKYTRQARDAGVQGYVILKVLLAPNGEIERVRVVRRLPYGLTESAIRAACEIKFKPAKKGGQPVAQWLNIEYAFRLTKSSIFGPVNGELWLSKPVPNAAKQIIRPTPSAKTAMRRCRVMPATSPTLIRQASFWRMVTYCRRHRR